MHCIYKVFTKQSNLDGHGIEIRDGGWKVHRELDVMIMKEIGGEIR